MAKICLLSALLLVVIAGPVFADGGALLFRNQSGPFSISVFGSPKPLRAGPVDISVMVQKNSDKSTVLNANVKVRMIRSAPDNVTDVVAPATHQSAINKLLYDAHLTVPSPGTWQLQTDVIANGLSANVSGNVEVSGAPTALESNWIYIAIVPFLALLFVFNRWLRRRYQVRHPRARV